MVATVTSLIREKMKDTSAAYLHTNVALVSVRYNLNRKVRSLSIFSLGSKLKCPETNLECAKAHEPFREPDEVH